MKQQIQKNRLCQKKQDNEFAKEKSHEKRIYRFKARILQFKDYQYFKVTTIPIILYRQEYFFIPSMKQKICISMDEETIKKAEELLHNGIYRNKSHLIEYALNKLMEEK